MAHRLMICPLCKYENTDGVRFCKKCGRLLVEPDLETSEAEHAPLYATQEAVNVRWETDDAADVRNARVVIRAYPADFDGSDSSSAIRVGEYALEGQTITIGRTQDSDIIFDKDTMVSRRHAILRPEANQYVVTDLGSANGTFVNDVEISAPTPIKHGDRILIGQHELLFLLDQPRPIAAPAPLPGAAAPATGPRSGPAQEPPAEQARPTAAPVGATAKYASVARLSSELAASASRMAAPQQDSGEFDAIRTQLVEASEALTRQAGIQAALAERRRAALVEARERVADLIADLRGENTGGDSPTRQPPQDLAALADRVAADPNNLEHLRALARQAGAIANALRAQGPSEGQWSVERARAVRALEDIHLRLQERA